MAAANGVREKILLGQSGDSLALLGRGSSHLIRKYQARGGIILSASHMHMQVGPNGDFGIKFNTQGGEPAPEAITERIYQKSRCITSYKIAPIQAIPMDKTGQFLIAEMQVENY